MRRKQPEDTTTQPPRQPSRVIADIMSEMDDMDWVLETVGSLVHELESRYGADLRFSIHSSWCEDRGSALTISSYPVVEARHIIHVASIRYRDGFVTADRLGMFSTECRNPDELISVIGTIMGECRREFTWAIITSRLENLTPGRSRIPEMEAEPSDVKEDAPRPREIEY